MLDENELPCDLVSRSAKIGAQDELGRETARSSEADDNGYNDTIPVLCSPVLCH